MDRRDDRTAAWNRGIGPWARLWQMQIDQTLAFWAAWAAALPRPTAAELSAEAERSAGKP